MLVKVNEDFAFDNEEVSVCIYYKAHNTVHIRFKDNSFIDTPGDWKQDIFKNLRVKR